MSSSAVKPGPSEVARHIARVAARLFAERGYDATSVREIVEAAGVAKPTLYYHFQSKEGLANALISVPLGGLIERLKLIVETESDPVRCLEGVLEAHFAFCRDDPDRIAVLVRPAVRSQGVGYGVEYGMLQGRPETLDRSGGASVRGGRDHPGRPGRRLHDDVSRDDRDFNG